MERGCTEQGHVSTINSKKTYMNLVNFIKKLSLSYRTTGAMILPGPGSRMAKIPGPRMAKIPGPGLGNKHYEFTLFLYARSPEGHILL